MQTLIVSTLVRNRFTTILSTVIAAFLLTCSIDCSDAERRSTCEAWGCQDPFPIYPAVLVAVTEIDGNTPVAVATVDLSLKQPQSYETPSNGLVRFADIDPGTYTVTAKKDGYLPNSAAAVVPSTGDSSLTVPVSIRLVRVGGTLTGKVTDAKTPTLPIIGASLVLAGPSPIQPRTTVTDTNGVYRFTDVPVSAPLTLHATAPKYNAADSPAFTLAPNESKTVDLPMTATPVVPAVGTVTLSLLDGTNASKIPLTVVNSATWNGVPMNVSTSTGGFSLANTPSGSGTLAASLKGYEPISRKTTLDPGGALNFTIPAVSTFSATPSATCESMANSYHITLDWQRDSQRRPDDLDLLLVIPRSGSTTGCFLDNDVRGNLCESPGAQLQIENTHIASDPPVETVDIARLSPGTYMVVVHDYGAEVDHKNAATFLGDPKTAATVTIYGPKGVVTATAPAGPPEGYLYWIPFTIDGTTGTVTPTQNSIVPLGTSFAPKECHF